MKIEVRRAGEQKQVFTSDDSAPCLFIGCGPEREYRYKLGWTEDGMKIITDGKQEPVRHVSNGRPMFISMVRPPFGDWEPVGVSFDEKITKLRAKGYAEEFGDNLPWRVDTTIFLTDEYPMVVASNRCCADAKERTT